MQHYYIGYLIGQLVMTPDFLTLFGGEWDKVQPDRLDHVKEEPWITTTYLSFLVK